MAFEPDKWANGADGGTPMTADELNRLEAGGAARRICGGQGAEGAQGPTGAKGDTGADGARGPAGADGEDGAQGPKGDKGDPGADGADGFGTEAQYNDIIARLEALESAATE